MKKISALSALKKRLCEIDAVNKYFTDRHFKALASLYTSLGINSVYAVWEIICGIWYRSFWFITLGCYYILLSVIRLTLVRGTRGGVKSPAARWKRYRSCGITLLLMNIILTGIVVLAVMNSYHGSRYAGCLIYAVAAYTFYKIVSAIVHALKFRSTQSPILSANMTINLVTAVVSMLSLEIAMILHFGNDPAFFASMTIMTGIGACLVISVMAVKMILAANKRIRAEFNHA